MRGKRKSERAAQPAAAAGRDFVALWIYTKQQHTTTQLGFLYSMLNAQLNGDGYGRD